MKEKKQKENLLDYIPKRNELMKWEENKKGMVEVLYKNKGLFNRIAQIFFRRPKVSRIELDKLGSFIWKTMDGKMSIYELGKLVKEKFGDEAEPLYERLCSYMTTLHDNGFIVYVNLQNKSKEKPEENAEEKV